ncbi:uncharacterized protein LODBEIA_P49020 [Lodderomyces beijingensis]|uniref:Bul1 N-terminal domain-containing protein n=1 Tax=Lodderomyces beijingensis TaxID=1775926 RepID=A0ABP0ZR95_9ASCO
MYRTPNGSASDLPPSYENSVPSSRSASPARTPASSSSSSNSQTRKPKNVPYRPSKEQQKQINLLTNARSNKPVKNLSSVSSNVQTEYFDVLPSFEMFQSLLKRDDQQFQEDLSAMPPVYGDTTHSRSSLPTTPTARLSPQQSIDQNLMSVSQRLEGLQRDLGAAADDSGLLPVMSTAEANSGVHNENVAVTRETYGHSPLDNIDRLEKAQHSPIDIQIFVTKGVPQIGVGNELETRLKEYTSGEHVNGYVIVTNTSDAPVRFGLFTVSLEGTIKSLERSPHSSRKYSKILVKKVLKMYDLSAGYSYGYLPNSAGIEYEPGSLDESDGCQVGLPDSRVMEPHGKYKKFFTFKFPHVLLDYACSDSIMQHLLPPPSMGVDKTCFYNRGEGIVLNKALGYGSLNLRGTPVVTRDYSFDDLSTSYAIEAKIIDSVNSKEVFSHEEINDAKQHDYVISKSAQYFLRFVPDVREQVEYCKTHDVAHYTGAGVARKFMEQYQYNTTWDAIAGENRQVEKEIEGKFASKQQQQQSLTEMKMKNLSLRSTGTTVLDTGDVKREPSYYISSRPREILGKKKKLLGSSTMKVGESTMRVRVPDKMIAYSTPRLLMKYNEEGPKNLYGRNLHDILDDVEVEISYEGDAKPQIASVDINVVIWSYFTEYPLPFELGYDFFYKNYDDSQTPEEAVQITTRNLQHLKDKVSHYIDFVKQNNVEVSKDAFTYLKAAEKLGVKKDTVRKYFKTAHVTDHWQVHKGASLQWKSKLKVPLVVDNKRNENLLPTFQSCLVGRVYCLEVAVKLKGVEANDASNTLTVDVPVIVG